MRIAYCSCRPIVAVLCPLLALALPADGRQADAPPPRQGERLLELAHEAEARAEALRGLSFERETPITTMDRERIARELREIVEREYPPAHRLLLDRSLKVFGLVPAESDVLADMLALVVSQAGGFYDTTADRVVLPDDLESFIASMAGAALVGGAGGDAGDGLPRAVIEPMLSNVLTHEYTHALQDQHFDLDGLMAAAKRDDDASLALSALVEGDATLIGTAAMAGDDPRAVEAIASRDPSAMAAAITLSGVVGPEAASLPPILRQSLLFPYAQGFRLVATLASAGGLGAVDAAYADPPISTEQVLHPGKYTNEVRDEPVWITLPTAGLSDHLSGLGFSLVGENTLGEFQVRVLLGDGPDAWKAAEGWDGDRYAVYEADDGRLAVLWVSVWDSGEDAEQFAAEYIAHESRRFEGAAARVRSGRDPAGWRVRGVGRSDDVTMLALRGERVAVARGLPAAAVAGALDAVRDGLQTSPKTWALLRARADSPDPAPAVAPADKPAGRAAPAVSGAGGG